MRRKNRSRSNGLSAFVTRFAPSPTGPLHLGHAYSAILAHDLARDAGGTFHLRIEDIDQSRARSHWEAQIMDDLAWLGLDWHRPVMRQSERMSVYADALDRLAAMGLTYACTCTRRDVIEAAHAPQEGAPLTGPDGIVYPGTCKFADHPHEGAAIRLHLDRALARTGPISTVEEGSGQPQTLSHTTDSLLISIGDPVLARRGLGTSYHLSVVVDDAAQEITHVVRGADLAEAAPLHAVLHRLLGTPTPRYHHHRLIRDPSGRRLAKRDDARAISAYRDDGADPQDIRRMVGLTTGT